MGVVHARACAGQLLNSCCRSFFSVAPPRRFNRVLFRAVLSRWSDGVLRRARSYEEGQEKSPRNPRVRRLLIYLLFHHFILSFWSLVVGRQWGGVSCCDWSPEFCIFLLAGWVVFLQRLPHNNTSWTSIPLESS